MANATEAQGLPQEKRVENWKEDLHVYATELPAKHIDFRKIVPSKEFARQVAELQSAVPALTDQQIVLRLMRLTASLGVAHTRVYLPEQLISFHRIPLILRWYVDGLWVLAAADGLGQTLGTRVVSIGTMSPEQLLAALAPYISHENQSGLRQSSPNLMLVEELLGELKLTEADGRVLFAFARPDGTNFTLRLPGAHTNNARLTGIQRSNTPLAAKHPRQAYWYEFLPDSKTLYIQYNRCQNDPAEPFKEFASRLFAAADARGSERVIVDLRFNGGGNSEIIRPLLTGLRARPKLCAKGHLCALIGAATFSSGLWAACDLQKLGARLLGEPTGGKPNDYGDVKRFSLPHSRLQVQYATKKFRLVQGNPPSLEPDIVVKQSFGDLMAGRDPVLERALALSAPSSKE